MSISSPMIHFPITPSMNGQHTKQEKKVKNNEIQEIWQLAEVFFFTIKAIFNSTMAEISNIQTS